MNFKQLFLLCFICSIGFSLKAQSYQLQDDDVEVNADGMITSCSYDFTNTDIIIPDVLDGITILGIEDKNGTGVFDDKGITSIQLPSSLIHIGNYAFADNELLSITIPSSVEYIGIQSFSSNNFNDIDIPNSVTYIGQQAFWGLDSIVLPTPTDNGFEYWISTSGNTYQGGVKVRPYYYTFQAKIVYTLKDADVVIVNGAIDSCLYDFSSKYIIIPDTLNNEQITSISEGDEISYGNYNGVFSNKGIKEVQLPSYLTSIGAYAFYENELESLITLPTNVAYIGTDAFTLNSSFNGIVLSSPKKDDLECVNWVDNYGNIFEIAATITSFYGRNYTAQFPYPPGTSVITLTGELNFEDVEVDSKESLELTLGNDGNSPYTVSSIALPEGFSADWTSGEILSDSTQKINIIFSPTEEKYYSDMIKVISDANLGADSISVSGTGVIYTTGVATDSLICYYSFEGNALDKSGNEHHGTVEGATLTTDRFGRENGAYSFDGIDDYIQIQGNLNTNVVKQPVSISFWVKPELDSVQAIFGMYDTIGDYNPITGIYIGDHITSGLTNELIVVARNVTDSDKYILGKTSDDRSELFDNNWHHMVVVYNDTVVKVYRDDTIVITQNSWGLDNGRFGVPGDDPIVSLGARMHAGVYGAYFKGSLDDFRLYNIALNPTEVSELYNEVTTSFITLNGSLNFEDVEVNSQDSLVLTIGNTGDSTCTISSIVLPEGFSADWTSGEILSDSTQKINIIFSPTEEKYYSGMIKVIPDANLGADSISVSGTTVAQLISVITLTDSLRFEDVEVNSKDSLVLTIGNDGNSPYTVSSITLPEGFSADWTNGEVTAGNTQKINITFYPTEEKYYSGMIKVISDANLGADSISVSGTGIINGVPTDNLICYYSFEGNARDKSGNQHHGTVEGATLTTDRFGRENGAYSFDGIDDYIQIQGNLNTNVVKQPVSISFWVKPELDSAQAIFGMYDTIGDYNPITGIYIGDHITSGLTNELIVVARNVTDSDKYILGKTSDDRSELFDDNWHHMVVVYNDTVVKVYKDDNIVTTQNSWGSDNGRFGVPGDDPIVSLGARMHAGVYGAYLKGSLDDFRLYNIALNPTEVSELYNEVTTSNFIIAESSESLFNTYPNPTNGVLTIAPKENVKGYSIKVISMTGQILYHKTVNQDKVQINLKSIAHSGMCFVQLYDTSAALIEVKKIIVR